MLRILLRGFLTVVWAAAWHFSAWLLDATIKKAEWRNLAAMTTGVAMMYPPIVWLFGGALRELGASEIETKRAGIALGFVYWFGYFAGGVGVVIGHAIDAALTRSDIM